MVAFEEGRRHIVRAVRLHDRGATIPNYSIIFSSIPEEFCSWFKISIIFFQNSSGFWFPGSRFQIPGSRFARVFFLLEQLRSALIDEDSKLGGPWKMQGGPTSLK